VVKIYPVFQALVLVELAICDLETTDMMIILILEKEIFMPIALMVLIQFSEMKTRTFNWDQDTIRLMSFKN